MIDSDVCGSATADIIHEWWVQGSSCIFILCEVGKLEICRKFNQNVTPCCWVRALQNIDMKMKKYSMVLWQNVRYGYNMKENECSRLTWTIIIIIVCAILSFQLYIILVNTSLFLLLTVMGIPEELKRRACQIKWRHSWRFLLLGFLLSFLPLVK